jgi:Leucine-rich repeat (LRR) protein
MVPCYLALVISFAPAPEPDPAEQKALAALEAIGFQAKLSKDGSRQVIELGYSRIKGPDGKFLPIPADKDLAPLADLRNLVKLHLHSIAGDETLDLIRSPVLRDLALNGSKVTDKGLKKLAGFKKLAILELGNTGVTDDGLKTLSSFPALMGLGLSGTRVTDKELAALEKTQITNLNLNGTGVGDASIATLGKMPSLGVLDLEKTKVTDKGLAEIAKPGAFPKLQTLGLEGTAVSAAGLKVLCNPKALPSLRILCLERAIPPGAEMAKWKEVVEQLQQTRPGLEAIYYGPPGR